MERNNWSHDASAELFDPNGPTSLGSLKTGELVVRRDNIIVTGASGNFSFPVGAVSRAAPIPDSALIRGSERTRSRNIAGTKRIVDIAKVSGASEQMVHHLEQGAENAAENTSASELELSGNGMLPANDGGNGFLHQGIENPINITLSEV